MTQTKTLSDREFVLHHTFHAPAAKVFGAYLDPKRVAQWWAPKGGSLRVETMDVRPGGKWRYHQRTPDGQEVTFSGTYLEVEPVTRLVYTFQVEGQGPPLTATVELAEAGGTTRMTLTNQCASKEIRDAMLQYGAEAGARAAWNRLSELLGRGA